MSRTSGSRGVRALVPMDLRTVRERAVYRYLALTAQGGRALASRPSRAVPGSFADRRHAPVLRGRNAAGSMVLAGRSGLCRRCRGVPLERTRAPRRRLARGPAIAGTDVRGARRPPADRPSGCERSTEAGGAPHVQTFPSSAVRVCQAAAAAGLVIAGSRFTVLGEPLTPAATGPHPCGRGRWRARATPRWSAGPSQAACGAPAAADDTHVHRRSPRPRAAGSGRGRRRVCRPTACW